MTFATVLQGLGPLASPPALLVWIVVIAVILVVGRVVLALAWRLVLVALIVLTVLWLLGILGFEFGVFGMATPVSAPLRNDGRPERRWRVLLRSDRSASPG
jgi:hypothetical protein